MASPIADRAIAEILLHGRALLKYISPNDTGKTGSHQWGYYLPKKEWRLFTPQGPIKGSNHKHTVKIIWQDGRQTESCVTWYGNGTRSEFRLTKFGKGFPWLTADCIGDLLVLIPTSDNEMFSAYVLDNDNDIDELQAELGIEISENYAVYPPPKHDETPDDCIERQFKEYVATLTAFPPTIDFSTTTQQALINCITNFSKCPYDEQVLELVNKEYQLFKMAERVLCNETVNKLFRDIDDFLKTASSIMNRRKSRAGSSFEHHVAYILNQASIEFDSQPIGIPGTPDIIIPSAAAYFDKSYPKDKIIVLGVKTTCKDRWRQVLQEAPRIDKKHLITMQRGISDKQINEMISKNVQLVVPKSLHKMYPSASRGSILSVDDFVNSLKTALQS